MKRKFAPSAALGYKRIKPLYDKAIADLAAERKRADDNCSALADVQLAHDACTMRLARRDEYSSKLSVQLTKAEEQLAVLRHDRATAIRRIDAQAYEIANLKRKAARNAWVDAIATLGIIFLIGANYL